MGALLGAFASGVVFVPTLVIAALLTLAAVRGSRMIYVPSARLVLESFFIDPTAAQDPAICIKGRIKGLVAWLLTKLGMSNRVELTVTRKELIIRQGSLAGMKLIAVPLRKVKATVCGYQRSLLALFLAVFFALNALWTLLTILPTLAHALGSKSEAVWESTDKIMGTELFAVFGWLAACAIAVILYYASKRAVFAVDSRGVEGIAFKRSFIENESVDRAQVEQAAALLNRLVQSAIYDIPIEQIALPPVDPQPKEGVSAALGWSIGAGFAVLLLLAFILFHYGNGVKLEVNTVPPGATILIDKQYAGVSDPQSGEFSLEHVTRQMHSLEITSFGYQPSTQSLAIGGFEGSHPVSVKLALLNYPVTVSTAPASSHVAVDGKDMGVTGENGLLLIPQVDRGNHQFSISHEGYRTVTANIDIVSRREFRFDLMSEAEAARQEAQAHQQEVASHLDRARALFRQTQYQDAINECDAVLKIDPSNSAATTLKNQIEQTRKILGQ
jgi:hypothetical protein